MATTFANIKDQFYPLVGGGLEGANAFFSATQVTNWCNKALHELAEDCLYLDETYTDTIDADDWTVSPPAGSILAWRVEVDDEWTAPISFHALTSGNRQWKDVTGLPRYWYLNSTGSNPNSDRIELGLWPINDDDTTTWRTYCYVFPTDVSDGADTTAMEIPDWAHLAVLCSMLADALMADTKIKNLAAASVYRRVFDDIKDRLRARSFSKLPKQYAVGVTGKMTFNVWNQMPSTIPSP